MQYLLLPVLALLRLCQHMVGLTAAQPVQEVEEKGVKIGLAVAVVEAEFRHRLIAITLTPEEFYLRVGLCKEAEYRALFAAPFG